MSEGYADSGHIVSVEFDPKVKVYWWLGAMLVQASTVIGLFVVPFWLILALQFIKNNSKVCLVH